MPSPTPGAPPTQATTGTASTVAGMVASTVASTASTAVSTVASTASTAAGPAATLAIAGNQVALFASDMHLGEHDPDTSRLFFSALGRSLHGVSHLFLLGDLFDAWVGDDQPGDQAAELAGCLRDAASTGIKVLLMRGNRDFLLDTGGFCAATGSRMLEDPSLIELFGRRVLISHGDLLCTDDLPYQAVRRQVRDPAWQRTTLAQPLAARLAMARALRQRSEHDKSTKADYLMDVNQAEVMRVMRQAGADTMIHGHTHRPATHHFAVDGVTLERRVLPDWDARSGRGGFLRVDRSGWGMV